jgi:hypothetical protein
MTDHDIPQERDLPAGRLAQMKDDVMAQIDQDIDQEAEAAPPVVPPASRTRWRRVGLVAAAAAAAAGLTATLVGTGDDSASANTAVLNDDGQIVITVEESKNPEELERRLEALGLPAEVDFLESGYRCDHSRSTGWVEEPNAELFPPPEEIPVGSDQLILDADAVPEGQTLAIEFYFDEFEGETAAGWAMRLSETAVGECEWVEDPAVVVDAEAGIVGG